MNNTGAEYAVYKILEHWKPTDEIILVEELIDQNDKLSVLFSYLYLKTKQEYQNFSKRKDGTDPFVHPLNVFTYFRKPKSKIT